jgi:AhpD family alkylhydroperoxidase
MSPIPSCTTTPEAIKGLLVVERMINASALPHPLSRLVRLRASQMNGCTFCMKTSVVEARADGEAEMRLFMISAWRKSILYSVKERAALALTEALTNGEKLDELRGDQELIKTQLKDYEIVNLTVMVGAINLWNHLQIAACAVHVIQPSD